MPVENLENWFLRKHENKEVFGPVRFEKIKEWAASAQINPQDMVSNDQVVWTKAPMIPELEMDWLVELDEEVLYGPTTSGTLLEFVSSGEISADTGVINCVNGERMRLRDTPFFAAAQAAPPHEHAGAAPPLLQQPLKGGIRASLQKRVRELEQLLLERQRQLQTSKETIARLEARIKELEVALASRPKR